MADLDHLKDADTFLYFQMSIWLCFAMRLGYLYVFFLLIFDYFGYDRNVNSELILIRVGAGTPLHLSLVEVGSVAFALDLDSCNDQGSYFNPIYA